MTQTSQQKLVTGSDSGQVIAMRQKRGSRREHKLTLWFLGPFDSRDIHLGYRTFRGCLFLREEIVPFQKWNGSNFLPKTASATDVTLAARVQGASKERRLVGKTRTRHCGQLFSGRTCLKVIDFINSCG